MPLRTEHHEVEQDADEDPALLGEAIMRAKRLSQELAELLVLPEVGAEPAGGNRFML